MIGSARSRIACADLFTPEDFSMITLRIEQHHEVP
jgi:hypothetical protein